MEDGRFERGLETLGKVDGEGGTAVIESLNDIAPNVGRFIVEFAFGDIYTQGQFDLRDREIATVAALCALGGREPQLDVHTNGALNIGITEEEVIEVLIQRIPYVGFPRVLNAIGVTRSVFESRKV